MVTQMQNADTAIKQLISVMLSNFFNAVIRITALSCWYNNIPSVSPCFLYLTIGLIILNNWKDLINLVPMEAKKKPLDSTTFLG